MALVREIVELEVVEACPPTAFAIDSFTFNPTNLEPVEIGTIVANPAFNATYNQAFLSGNLTNDDNAEDVAIAPPGAAFASAQSYQKSTPDNVVFTLDATGPGGSAQATRTLRFLARLFVGWTTNPGPYTEADILALSELSNNLDADALFTENLSPDNAPNGAYLVCAYLDAFNGAVPSDFQIGNLGPGGVTEVQTGVSFAIPNGSTGYSIARSDFQVQAPGGIDFARIS